MSVDFSPEINNFMNAELGEAVRGSLVDIAKALETAINSQLITVDPTLTESGQGADAAITGEEIGNLTDGIDAICLKDVANTNTWTVGSLAAQTGGPFESTNRLRTNNFISVSDGVFVINVNQGYEFLVYAYSSGGTYIGCMKDLKVFDKNEDNYKWVNSYALYEHPEYKYKVVLRKEDNTDMQVSDAANCLYAIGKAADAEATGEITRAFNIAKENYLTSNYTDYIQGHCNTETGAFEDSLYWSVSDYIPIDRFYSFYKPVGIRVQWFLYNSDKEFIVYYGASIENEYTYLRTTITSDNVKYIRIAVSIYNDSAQIQTTPEMVFASNYNLLSFAVCPDLIHSAECNLEHGSLRENYGCTSSTYDNFYPVLRSEKIIKIEDSVKIEFDENDFDYIGKFSIWQYRNNNGVVEYVNRIDDITANNYIYIKQPDVDYIKLTVVLTEEGQRRSFSPVKFYSDKEIRNYKNPNLYESSDKVIEFTYKVSDDIYTKGQLILPPNYSINGEAVPLHVYCHGTGGMVKWETPIYRMTNWNSTTEQWEDYDFYDLLDYQAKEGFAIFNCYPWTSKYYADKRQISPFILSVQEMAYVEGIKYVCSRFNVDANAVCVSGFSLGGNMAGYLARQTEIPVKAVAMMAPTNSWVSLRWREYFIERNARELIASILNLQNATTFVETTYGVTNSTVRAYVQENLAEFAGQNISALGVFGANYQDLYDWSASGTMTKPAWMDDLPDIPSAWAYGIPQYVNHPELSAYAAIPIKYWQAFDDENTSAHSNYTVYNWLLNGGSQVYWRTLPNGCGGHGATGYGPLAPKMNWRTRLGIDCEDVPVAQVEMIQFFYECMGFDFDRSVFGEVSIEESD